MGNPDFGWALMQLKFGKAVARQGWNGKNMYLILVNADQYSTTMNFLCDPINSPMQLSWIGIKTAQNTFVPWLASQTDILAEDWEVV